MDYIKETVNLAIKIVRQRKSQIKKDYNNLAPIMDRLVARDIKIPINRVPFIQEENRSILWNTVFEEDFTDCEHLIKHLYNFLEIKAEQIKEKENKLDENLESRITQDTILAGTITIK